MNQFWRLEASTLANQALASSTVQTQPVNALEISLTVSETGMQLSMVDQGNFSPAMFLNECVPMLRFNTYLKAAIMPIIASYGPWSSNYGFRHKCVALNFTLSENDGNLTVTSVTQTITYHDNAPILTEDFAAAAEGVGAALEVVA